MPLPTSLNAYPDCYEFCEKCVDDPIGARRPFRTEGEAADFRNRCNRYRALTRQQNRQIYPPDDARHGTSDYDEVRFTIRMASDGWYFLYGRKVDPATAEIELLSEVEGATDDNETPA